MGKKYKGERQPLIALAIFMRYGKGIRVVKLKQTVSRIRRSTASSRCLSCSTNYVCRLYVVLVMIIRQRAPEDPCYPDPPPPLDALISLLGRGNV
jgi:hypothetical protein